MKVHVQEDLLQWYPQNTNFQLACTNVQEELLHCPSELAFNIAAGVE